MSTSNAAATAVHERKLDQAVNTVFSRTKDLKIVFWVLKFKRK